MDGHRFSLEVAIDDLPAEGSHFHLEADDRARESIATRLKIPAVARLSGEIELTPTRNGIRLSGVIDAALGRHCVASLEPLEEVIAEEFEILFSGAADLADVDPAAPEPLGDGVLDLAEILIQQLSLAMDPYPRRPDAPPLAESYGADGGRDSPFEALGGAFAGARDKE